MDRILYMFGIFLIAYSILGFIKYIFIKKKKSDINAIAIIYALISSVYINRYITEEARTKLEYNNTLYNFRFNDSYIRFNNTVYSLRLNCMVKCFKSSQGEKEISLNSLGIWIFDEGKQNTVMMTIVDNVNSDNPKITDEYDKKFIRSLFKSIKKDPDSIQFKCDGFCVEKFFKNS